MRIKVFTLFPDMLRAMLSESILGRAQRSGLIDVQLINIRDYTQDKHRRTDDYPFGGGAGMVMSAQPIVDAIQQNTDPEFHGRRVYLSPRGRTLTQRVVEELAREEELVLLCGHYEGVDQRALDEVIDEELSIGDYVLTGGELGALVVIDAVARLVPGVLGSEDSPEDESFSTGLLEYPQYTRPADFRGRQVPEVLLGGNHADIEAWRREQSLEITLARRPELLDAAPLTDADRAMLTRLRRARALDLPYARVDLRLTDQFPKRWLQAFVPEENRKAAKKPCLSGKRHVGYLWRAFTERFIDGYIEGDDARAAWFDHAPDTSLLYLPDDGLMYRVEGTPSMELVESLGHVVLTDESLTRTCIRTGKSSQYYYIEIQ